MAFSLPSESVFSFAGIPKEPASFGYEVCLPPADGLIDLVNTQLGLLQTGELSPVGSSPDAVVERPGALQDAVAEPGEATRGAAHANLIRTAKLNGDQPAGQQVEHPGEGAKDPVKSERHTLLAEFKRKGNARDIRVTDEAIAKAASQSWNTRTEVSWWKRNDVRSKPRSDELIRAVLAKEPDEIASLCTKPSQP